VDSVKQFTLAPRITIISASGSSCCVVGGACSMPLVLPAGIDMSRGGKVGEGVQLTACSQSEALGHVPSQYICGLHYKMGIFSVNDR
jgi:hypothetical protein